jgi:hypothetical protein
VLEKGLVLDPNHRASVNDMLKMDIFADIADGGDSDEFETEWLKMRMALSAKLPPNEFPGERQAAEMWRAVEEAEGAGCKLGEWRESARPAPLPIRSGAPPAPPPPPPPPSFNPPPPRSSVSPPPPKTGNFTFTPPSFIPPPLPPAPPQVTSGSSADMGDDDLYGDLLVPTQAKRGYDGAFQGNGAARGEQKRNRPSYQ